jgi:hypothetical protein
MRAKHMTIPVSPALLMGLRDLVQSPNDAKPALETQLIMADLPILTLEGALPAEHLYVGDRVITSIGALPLQALMPVHIAQPLRVVHLEAYAFGSDQAQPCDLFPSKLLKTRQGDLAFARDFIGQRGVRYRNLPRSACWPCILSAMSRYLPMS